MRRWLAMPRGTRQWATALAALALGLFGCDTAPRPVESPNLVLIIGDDVGVGDFGFMGSPHAETPHLDRLAEAGTVFRNGYSTASVCVPSLRSLLTGLHPYQWDARVAALKRRSIARPRGSEIQDFTTLPGTLKQHGYASFQAGKLWEASYALAGFTDGMQEPGDSMAMGGSGIELGRSTMAPVLEFIDAHQAEPFFLWFAPRLPHLPHDAPERYREPFQGRGLSEKALAYHANLMRFDAAVGELLAHLEERGLREKTLIVYVSDNGWDQDPDSNDWPRPGFAGPRGKMTMYDLGFRTPIVVSWPGPVPGGAVRDELVSAVDLFPTFLDYAGVPPPGEQPGLSLRPILEGSGEWRRRQVVGSMRELRRWDERTPAERQAADWQRVRTGGATAFFVRTEDWHYVSNADLQTAELYRVSEDPREERNLVAERPALASLFRREIERRRPGRAVRRAGGEEPLTCTPSRNHR
jgi:uncharacterized sulfatase